jgi:hypothetical protein
MEEWQTRSENSCLGNQLRICSAIGLPVSSSAGAPVIGSRYVFRPPIRNSFGISFSAMRAAWAERKALKENLLSFDETDLRDILAATALRLRGDGQKALICSGTRPASS